MLFRSSRTVVREAAKRLELQGIIEIQHGIGIKAVDKLHKPLNGSLALLVPDAEERLRQLNETRMAIEPESARLAAENATAAQIRTLKRIHQQLIDASDTARAIEADMAFHRALAEASGRRTLVYLGDFLQEDRGTELMIRDVAALANVAGVSISVIGSDAFVIPGPSQRGVPPPPRPGGEFGHLPLLTDLTGGEFYRRAVPGAVVVPRLVRDLSAQYVLAFEDRKSTRLNSSHRT